MEISYVSKGLYRFKANCQLIGLIACLDQLHNDVKLFCKASSRSHKIRTRLKISGPYAGINQFEYHVVEVRVVSYREQEVEAKTQFYQLYTNFCEFVGQVL
jgi:hypothetical protein